MNAPGRFGGGSVVVVWTVVVGRVGAGWLGGGAVVTPLDVGDDVVDGPDVEVEAVEAVEAPLAPGTTLVPGTTVVLGTAVVPDGAVVVASAFVASGSSPSMTRTAAGSDAVGFDAAASESTPAEAGSGATAATLLTEASASDSGSSSVAQPEATSSITTTAQRIPQNRMISRQVDCSRL